MRDIPCQYCSQRVFMFLVLNLFPRYEPTFNILRAHFLKILLQITMFEVIEVTGIVDCTTTVLVDDTSMSYHWTLLRRGLRATVPSIILCAKKWNRRAPQRRGVPHSGEGKNRRFHLIKPERRGYKKIPLVGFQDIYKTDLQNSFRVDRAKLRGVSCVVTQIPSGT